MGRVKSSHVGKSHFIREKAQNFGFGHALFTIYLTWHLLYEEQYIRNDIVNSGVVTGWQIDSVIRMHKKSRILDQVGRSSVLYFLESIQLEDWIKNQISIGQNLNMREIEEEVFLLCFFSYLPVYSLNKQARNILKANRFNDETTPHIHQGWGDHFIQRSPRFKCLKGHLLDTDRLKACNQAKLSPFYKMMQNLLYDENGKLKCEDCNVYNFDEVSSQIKGHDEKVAVHADESHVQRKEPKKTVLPVILFLYIVQ
jgi:hypothetical protein